MAERLPVANGALVKFWRTRRKRLTRRSNDQEGRTPNMGKDHPIALNGKVLRRGKLRRRNQPKPDGMDHHSNGVVHNCIPTHTTAK